VLGIAVPVPTVHQLSRGAARVHVVSSLAAVATLVLAEVATAALLQLRHEFGDAHDGGRVVAATVVAVTGALVVGSLVDMIVSVPRFDEEVPRGLLGLIAATALGGAVGYLMLHPEPGFDSGRAIFAGAALGAVAGLLAVASAFVLFTTPQPASAARRALRPVLAAALPLALLAPGAFLLMLAIRR
jgi:hypothetical protein